MPNYTAQSATRGGQTGVLPTKAPRLSKRQTVRKYLSGLGRSRPAVTGWFPHTSTLSRAHRALCWRRPLPSIARSGRGRNPKRLPSPRHRYPLGDLRIHEPRPPDPWVSRAPAGPVGRDPRHTPRGERSPPRQGSPRRLPVLPEPGYSCSPLRPGAQGRTPRRSSPSHGTLRVVVVPLRARPETQQSPASEAKSSDRDNRHYGEAQRTPIKRRFEATTTRRCLTSRRIRRIRHAPNGSGRAAPRRRFAGEP